MGLTVNVHAAKRHLSRLIDAASAGEEVIIAKAGKPVAKLGPIDGVPTLPRRRLGLLHGKATIPRDFDAPLPESTIEAFENS